MCKPEFIDAVPKIAHWKISEVPRHLPPVAVDKVVGASTSPPHSELRDKAILLLLAELGLRARDIVILCLSDIDWEHGRIRLVGKGRRESWLPLPQRAGDRLLAFSSRSRANSMTLAERLMQKGFDEGFKEGGT
ncbi:TPA: tyrosine-type recombinase/integrase [Escherichia coli]|nr:tyrosine-type recombinase/integrase [Escherichia coli]HEF4967618.1 tyrosine-type recombinase/integrase [Escherichia coli]HEI2299528.1 tyrosine-type recombinase/integrase [Escherichia coli]